MNLKPPRICYCGFYRQALAEIDTSLVQKPTSWCETLLRHSYLMYLSTAAVLDAHYTNHSLQAIAALVHDVHCKN